MKYLKFVLLSFISLPVFAQTTIRQDAAIKQMVDEVSSKNIEANIRKLVTFKSRHTLSDTTSKTEGIGAARNWVKAELEKYAKESGGRLTVQFDTFTSVKGDKNLKNILAILKGTDATDNRIYLVSGHLDSRRTDINSYNEFEPGANDDASGTAVSMELARVMSKRAFPATIIFTAVVGEEQYLWGSTHLAKRAKAENWNIDAMLDNDIVGNTYGIETDLKDNRSVRVAKAYRLLQRVSS